jgi:CDGSH-type Zn-finger protein
MPTKITIRDNGSIRIEGDFEIYDMKGTKYDLAGRTQISLCRCGLSEKKPFCDSAHKGSAFRSECSAYTLEAPVRP